jgi:hypothetical protein
MTFHRFAYMTEPAREDDLRPHELRDGDAYCSLLPAFIRLGHESGTPLINHPLSGRAPDTSLADMAFLTEDDLLVITSRPPIDDKRSTGGAKVSNPSNTVFEQEVLFPVLTGYLKYCSRKQVTLNTRCATPLEDPYQNRKDLNYFIKPDQKKGRYEASYQMGAGGGQYEPFKADRTTAAYLIHTPPLEMPGGRKGPRVLVSFGLSGTVGYIFAHHLCEQRLEPFQGLLEDILRGPGFAMVEITVTRDVPAFYTTLDFSDDWKYKLITKRPVPRPMAASEGHGNIPRPTRRGYES